MQLYSKLTNFENRDHRQQNRNKIFNTEFYYEKKKNWSTSSIVIGVINNNLMINNARIL